MKKIKMVPLFTVLPALLALLLCLPIVTPAHCDTIDGPVVQKAREALAKSDITPLLKWVQVKDEKEIRAAFQKTLAVRVKGAEAKELADMYFFETLVRIHRAGEGAPYTGLKPGEAVDPAVALADKALESGSVDKLVDVLTKAMGKGFPAFPCPTPHAYRSLNGKKQLDMAILKWSHIGHRPRTLAGCCRLPDPSG